MKILLTLAASLAALTSASATQAAEAPSDMPKGHYEWQSRPVPGPNKSNLQQRVRVWVKDVHPEMANCDCAMMRDKASASECMEMPRKS